MSKSLLLLASVFLFSLLAPPVVGHGSMVKPASWIDTGGHVGMTPYGACSAGSTINVTDQPYQSAACFWYNNFTFIPGEPTLDPSMLTFPQLYSGGWDNYMFAENPWSAPGSAPLHSPCGVAGGNPNGCPVGSSQKIGDSCVGAGWAYGPLAEEFYVSPGFPDVLTTEWKVGAVVEVAWGMTDNHGGGYSYRLCKVPKEGMGALTEECFQEGHLEFSGNKQWVQTGENISTRVEFEAHRTKKGTFPKGSEWTKNPIPNCLLTEENGDHADHILYDTKYYADHGLYDANCSIGTQFPPPAPGLFGHGQRPPPNIHPIFGFWLAQFGGPPMPVGPTNYYPNFGFSIVDQLEVPRYLNPGDYVLSFRWDCDQEHIVWNQCANIKIVE